ncbi:SMP-30/gluconolactonase/LRE family protein [Georgenia faecalis]|uniref:SMP-30/gluconolactonase/LRE family protein n=1 Tax=Georgenia faecalis TaxID=2483799 RepID=A0ABV9D904_9MICO|nr:SMP-30/gluconolactonase/LRE family protein [Georgenia faecalis]
MTQVEQVTDPIAYHAEGPVWSPTWGGLRYVDMLAGDLLTIRSHGVDRLHVGNVAAFVRPRAGGGYVVGVERGIALAGQVDEAPEQRPELWADPGVRMNEGGADPWGYLYAGSMPYDQTPGGAALYRVSPAGDVDVVLPSVTVSNGIAFSPDGSLAYYNDTPTGGIDVFDASERGLTARRRFVTVPEGSPDGLTVDSAGNVWTALHGTGTVRCYAPDGGVVTEVRVPAHQVTACTLGGDDLRDLYITTSRENLGADAEPEAGAVFRVRVDVAGMPVLPYGG